MTFEEFAASRLPAVLAFAGVLTGQRATAEDIAQEVLIRAYTKVGHDRRPGPAGVLHPEDGAERVPVLAPKILAADSRGRRRGRDSPAGNEHA